MSWHWEKKGGILALTEFNTTNMNNGTICLKDQDAKRTEAYTSHVSLTSAASEAFLPPVTPWRTKTTKQRMSNKGPSPITGILFQTNDVRLSWTPPPPPPSKRTHTLGKMLTKKCRYCLPDATHGGVLLSEVFQGRPVMSLVLQKDFFVLLERGWSVPSAIHSAHHQECSYVLLASLTALATARDHEDRESALQKTSTNSCRLGHEGLPVSEVCNIMDFFVTETTGKSCKTTCSSPKMLQKWRFFFSNEQASTLPSLKRTSFVWNKMPVIGDGP